MDRLHAVVPIFAVQMHTPTNPLPGGVGRVLRGPLTDGIDVGVILHLTSSSGRNRMDRRRLESSIRRTRVEHARSGRAAEVERKIRADERYCMIGLCHLMAGDDSRMAGGESRMTGDCCRPERSIHRCVRTHSRLYSYIYGLVALLDNIQLSFSKYHYFNKR